MFVVHCALLGLWYHVLIRSGAMCVDWLMVSCVDQVCGAMCVDWIMVSCVDQVCGAMCVDWLMVSCVDQVCE